MSPSAACLESLTRRIAARRLRFEATADALFDAAWSSMRELAQPFRFELDLCREPSGCWRDLFVQMPYRFMDLPLVLLEDLGLPDDAARERLELGLLDQTALSAAAILALELVLEAEAQVGYEHVLLHTTLSAHAEWQLATLARDLPAARARSLAAWNQAADALLSHRQQRIGRCTPYTASDLPQLGGRWAPLKGAMACALEQAGRVELWSALEPLLDEAACLFQLGRELGRITRDVSRGHYSLPIARLLQGLGLTPAVDAPPDPDHTLLAALLPRTAEQLAAEQLARLDALRAAVEALGLPMLAHGLAPLAEPFERLRTLYRPSSVAAPVSAGATVKFSVSARPQLAQVLSAAQGLLAADPDYRDAWEVYRWGFLNVPDLTCKVFPIGLILANRIAAGDDCAAELDALFERYASNRFHYFEQSSSLPPDCDTLGLMLGLTGHTPRPAHWRAVLEEPLGWLIANVEPDGGLPVFLTRGVDAGDGRAYHHVAGRRCAAVQARLLLGLRRHDVPRYRDLLVRSARQLCGQIVEAGAFWHYDVPLGAGLVLELADALARDAVEVDTAPAVEVCVNLLRQQVSRARASAQEAALLWLATGSVETARSLRHPAWAELMIRSQQQDGGWLAAPLYNLPTRGQLMSWYYSRLVSTSFVYRALREVEREAPGRRR
jgi:hypothetical protein